MVTVLWIVTWLHNVIILYFRYKVLEVWFLFFWTPSHIGIDFNEVVDSMTIEATDMEVIDTENYISSDRIKRGMTLKRNEHIRKILENGNQSMERYLRYLKLQMLYMVKLCLKLI